MQKQLQKEEAMYLKKHRERYMGGSKEMQRKWEMLSLNYDLKRKQKYERTKKPKKFNSRIIFTFNATDMAFIKNWIFLQIERTVYSDDLKPPFTLLAVVFRLVCSVDELGRKRSKGPVLGQWSDYSKQWQFFDFWNRFTWKINIGFPQSVIRSLAFVILFGGSI